MHEHATHYDDVTLDPRPRSQVLPALACGVIAGLALGLLFAPARGSETRRRLKSAAQTGYNRTSRFVSQGRDAARTHAATVGEFVDRTRRRVQAGSEDAARAIRSVANAVADTGAERRGGA